MNIYKADAEVAKIRADNEDRDTAIAHLDYDHPARREVRATRQWVADRLIALAAIEAGLPVPHLPAEDRS